MKKSLLVSALAGALLIPSLVTAEQVVVTEIMHHPTGENPEFIEILNLTSNRLDTAKWRLTGGVELNFQDFNPSSPNAHFLKENERVVLSSAAPAATRAAYPTIPPGLKVLGPWTGRLNNAGDQIVLEDASGTRVCEVNYGDGGKWPVAADGTGHSLVLVNENRAVDDWRNWRASPFNGGSPGNAEMRGEEAIVAPDLPILVTSTVTNFNSTPATGGVPAPANPGDSKWKYYGETVAPPANWAQPGFDDSTWGPSDPALGYAPLGFEPATTSTTFPGIRTPIAPNQPLTTYYFRTTFEWNRPAIPGNSFVIDEVLDDGAVVWLNGQIIGRDRLTTTPALHTSPATAASPDGGYEVNRIPGVAGSLNGKLVVGTNTLAVEVHNVQNANDDMTMAMRLKITGPPPGPVINEVKPSASVGTGFVEFYNPLAQAVDLNGYYLSDNAANLTKFKITTPLPIAPGGLATIDFAGSGLSIANPVTVHLTSPDGISKQSSVAITMLTDSRSAGRKPAGASQWFLFSTPTPGAPNQSAPVAPTSTLTLSEAHFSAAGHVDRIEIANAAPGVASGAGLFVAATADFSDRVPLPASVSGGGFASITTDFAVDGTGDVVLYLIDAQNNVLETAELTARPGLPSVQRFPANSKEWYNVATPTKDPANNPARHDEIVINEIMFAPPSSQSPGEFVELYNRGAAPVSLAGWRFVDGLSFEFPPAATLAPGQYAVVATNPAYMTASYPGLTNVYGPAGGALRNNGEVVRLEDERRNLADSVDYRVGGQWPSGTSGEGSSLELIHPDMDNRQPSAWRASDESHKTVLQNYSYTDTYRELRGLGTPSEYKELLVTAAGDAHLLLKDISLTRAGSANLITTGDKTSHTGSGAAGFLCTGTHCQSDTLPRVGATLVGDDGFHLISTGNGDTKNNKAEVDCTGIVKGNLLTLTFQARWISGNPLLIMQTWDRSFGKVFRLPIPANLGTPGAANSTAIPAPAPTVDDMIHSPAVPKPTDSVVVKARVSSFPALSSVELLTREDNDKSDGAWSFAPMNDAGTDGDAVAGDGIYSATTAPKADAVITQFYIRATAQNGRTSECPRDGASRPAMWIVDNSSPTGKPGTIAHRFVFSKYDRDALGTNGFTAKFDWDFPRMSNFEFNTTVILGETTFGGGADVLYNGGMRKGGSPWTRAADNLSGLSRMRWKPPGDNLFRNRSKTGVDNDASGGSRFHNRISRYMMYLFGYPVPDAEFIQQIVNEDAPRLGDDMEPTDSDFFDRAYPNGSDGELFEIDDAWFMLDTFSSGSENRLSADGLTGRWAITDWSTSVPAYPSAESPIFYHGNWPVRFPEDRYDYGALSSFIKSTAIGTTGATGSIATEAWREQVERQLDTNRAAIYAAVRGYTGDWDNFTMERGKNGYFYCRPTDGKFEFHHWDSDLSFDAGRGFLGGAGGAGWTNYSGRPWFRRAMDFYLTELVTKYTKGSARMQAWLDAMNYQSANTGEVLAPFKTSVYNYPGFFTSRETPAKTFINLLGQTATSKNFDRPFSITTATNQTVATPRFAIAGDGPTRIWTIDIPGHPEAVLSWLPDTTSYGKWSLSNIALAAGVNSLSVRALSLDGSVFASLPFTVTLSTNAPPIALFTADPPSMNVATGELIVLDGTSSADPEGGPLAFSWAVTPLVGASLAHSVPGKTEAHFTVPGIYTVTMAVTDSAGLVTSATPREVTVFASDDFEPFAGGEPLDPALTVQNVEPRDNYSPSSWYSVEDISGRLQLQVLDDTAKPLGNPTFNHPLITRLLPVSSDFVLQTDLECDTREFGPFITGLWLEFFNAGQPIRYAFGLAGGTNLALFSAVGSGPWEMIGTSQAYTAAANATGLARLTVADSTNYVIGQSVLISGSNVPAYDGLRRITAKAVGSITIDTPFTITGVGTITDPGAPYVGTEAILRVRRTGVQLAFDQQVGGVWTQIRTATLSAGATAGRGGIFVATTAAITVRVSFDYFLVVDPTRGNKMLRSLRLTEVMYHPAGDGVEYLELTNIGAEPITLKGGNFAESQPFAAYVFGPEMVNPGEFVILASNVGFFKDQYGDGPRVLGAWSTGNLNNAGERIVLRDSQGNSIHDFAYDDAAPWPTQPDGLGPSLEVIDVNGDYNDPANWRASFEPFGSPGFAGLGVDSDGDGQSDGVEGFFGTDPHSATSQPVLSVTMGTDGSMTFTIPTVPGRSYRLDRTANLAAWDPLQTVVATATTTSFTDSTAAPAPEYFYRVVALPLP